MTAPLSKTFSQKSDDVKLQKISEAIRSYNQKAAPFKTVKVDIPERFAEKYFSDFRYLNNGKIPSLKQMYAESTRLLNLQQHANQNNAADSLADALTDITNVGSDIKDIPISKPIKP